MVRKVVFLVAIFLSTTCLAIDPSVAPAKAPQVCQAACPSCPWAVACQRQQPPQAVIWGQPGIWKPKHYATPLRNALFGTKKFVPQGQPVPYMLVPGQVVFPGLVQPQITYPQAQPSVTLQVPSSGR